jgi:Domain of unknown function (DUF4432)
MSDAASAGGQAESGRVTGMTGATGGVTGGVTIEEGRLTGGWRSVTLRSPHLEVVVLPEKGGEIYALRSLRHDVDVLWKSPWGPGGSSVPSAVGEASQVVWLDHYGGGWQDLFPNAGAACTVAGAAHPFHGEASVVPWECVVGEARGGTPEVRLTVRLARSPFRLEKRIRLEPDRPVLRFWERAVNESNRTQPYLWGQHPAFGAPFLAGGARLDVPATTFIAAEPQVSPQSRVVPGSRSGWPLVAGAAPGGGGGNETGAGGGGAVDLSVVPGPEAATDTLGFLLDLAGGWYALSNDALGLGFGLAWPVEVFPCVWLWQELCGTQEYPWYGTSYVMGVEPHTSCPADGLAMAVARGAARTLGPGEGVEADLTAVLFAPGGRVAGVSPDGAVSFG